MSWAGGKGMQSFSRSPSEEWVNCGSDPAGLTHAELCLALCLVVN